MSGSSESVEGEKAKIKNLYSRISHPAQDTIRQRKTNTMDGIKWAAAWQNQQNDLCAQRRLRSAWASAQSDQSFRCSHD